MKRLRGTIQAMGHRIVHLVDPEHVGLLRFQETGESPKGMDFAVLWNGAWRDGVVTPRFPRAPLFLSVPRLTLNGYVGLASGAYLLDTL